jgi:hypothetical protein
MLLHSIFNTQIVAKAPYLQKYSREAVGYLLFVIIIIINSSGSGSSSSSSSGSGSGSGSIQVYLDSGLLFPKLFFFEFLLGISENL